MEILYPGLEIFFVWCGQITGEDRNQLMKLQYRIGKLELDNMELEQSRVVHESAMRGKDLTIQKLQLQVHTIHVLLRNFPRVVRGRDCVKDEHQFSLVFRASAARFGKSSKEDFANTYAEEN